MKEKVETVTIEWNGGNLACRWRPGKENPIIFLHGICGSSAHFNTAFIDPSLCNHSLLAIDLPGYGNSSPISSWNLDLVGEAIKTAMEHFLDHKPWAVAHSISSSVVIRLIKYLSGIILLEGNMIPQHLDFSDKVLKSKRHEYTKEYERIQRASSMVLKYQTYIKDNILLDYYSTTYALCSADTVWDTANNCSNDIKDLEVIKRLSKLDFPVYCLYGAESNYKKSISDVKKVFPDMQLHTITNSRHFPMIDNPEETWRIVVNILRKGSR